MTLIDTSAWIEFFRAKGDSTLESRMAALISFGAAATRAPSVSSCSSARDLRDGPICEQVSALRAACPSLASIGTLPNFVALLIRSLHRIY